MPESFGARLRERRERQHIDLITIAEQTKIKLSLLEALERDDTRHWPSGIFRRAFIRAYAHAIGLDPDVVVREFLVFHPDPAEVIEPLGAVAAAADTARGNGGPPTRLRHIVGSAIGSLSRLRRGSGAEDPPDAPSSATGTSRFALPETATPAVAPSWAVPGSDMSAAAVPRENAVPSSPQPEPALQAISLPSEPGEIDEPQEAVERSSPSGPETQEAVVERGSACEPEHGPANPLDSRERDVSAAPSPEPDATAANWPRPDLQAVADLCTEFGRVDSTREMQRVLQGVARILNATGLVVWIWDARAAALRPALAHGYSDKVLAQLPGVGRDENNATAAAFRTVQPCAIHGSDHACGALVVPLVTPGGCAGVLAIELPQGREQAGPVRAVATIFAALLAQMAGGASSEMPQTRSEDLPPVQYQRLR